MKPKVKVVILMAAAAEIAAAVGAAFIMLVAVTALDGFLVEPNGRLHEIFLTVMFGAIFVTSVIAGVTAFQYVQHLLLERLDN